ncbi:intracellular septation protein [Succinivibrio dextrinosolvens]|uniref:septation protein IspZ n=1 Tax=Succinivibrio dextrinosolvens TaxID=83771 RepID=UPI0008EA0A08|nr:septation protein IspZ [Succinivibrio dextrinosolvens]SFS81214.1 intracellular septation protein [Succinivibrio dextrinosolvens]
MLKILQFLPVILWFVTYKMTSNLILATAVIVVACLITTAIEYFMTRQLSRMQIFLVAAILIFGLPTVLLNDPAIIKWKVTVVNMLFAATIFVFQFILKKNPFAFLFEKELPLPEEAYNTLSLWWMVFFVLAGLLNIVIAFYLPALIGVTEIEAEEIWVDYKTFGNAILNGVFALICGFVLLKKYPEIMKNLEK